MPPLLSQLLQEAGGWQSFDITLSDDSLDITFEKDYSPVTIDSRTYIPSASVTISVTVHEDDGITEINYDVDITLEETEGELEIDDEDIADTDDDEVELTLEIEGEVTPGESITVHVTFQGDDVEGATVTVNGEALDEKTSAGGLISFIVPDEGELEIEVVWD